MLKNLLAGVALVTLLTSQALAYGPAGHQLVGQIADELLKGKPAAGKVSALLHGITLAEAAKIPDDIKGWDSQPSPHLHWTNIPPLYNDMKAFLAANSNGPGSHGHNPDHHAYHYTDISVSSDLKYDKHKTGAEKNDVVQMIPFCIKVLKGTAPQPNSRKITPTVAVILLAHYLGDIHQPLHVGAAYFDDHGKLVDPDTAPSSHADHGGNDIEFGGGGLHTFWDGDTVKAAIHKIKTAAGTTGGTLTHQEMSDHFVTKKPNGHPLDQNVALSDLAVTWANEILPTAKEAHDRLKFKVLPPPANPHMHGFLWSAEVIPGHGDYSEWAGGVVDASIHKAGWRLAALLEKAL